MPFNQAGPSNCAHIAGNYNDITGNQIHNVYNIDTSTTLSRLKVILNPAHLPGADRPTCLRGSRTRIRGQISKFIDDKNSEPNVAFLLGAAGTGKSAIATSIADHYREKKQLGCHLFFLRGKSDPNTLIKTIAYNLAVFNESIAHSIEGALEGCGDLSSATLNSQFDILLRKSLASNHIPCPVLVVLDAIDECGTSQTRHTLLRVLGEGLTGLPPNFRFLITGRPESDIMSFSHSLKAREINLNDATNDNKKDVCTYINHEFGLRRNSVNLPNDWPWDDNMAKLGDAADGLFIWASTAVKFVFEGKLNRIARLNSLVSNARALDLKELYVTVLESSFDWNEETRILFSSVFSIIFFGKEPLSDEIIDGILGVDPGTTSELLSCLRSLVSYEMGQPVKIHHTSFYDYLVSCVGCRWHINSGSQKRSIANNCLNKMNQLLRFNICDLESSFLFNEQVLDFQKRIERNIPMHLRYICCYWGHHIRETSYSPELDNLLKTFAHNKLLFWFEVLSLTDTFDDYVGTALVYAISWIGNKDPELSAFLRDAYRQASIFSEAISRSAPHIYCSLLPLTRDESVVSLHYKKYASPAAHIKYIGNRQRSAIIKVIKSGDEDLIELSFSPDGTRIVSTAGFDEVCMWDAASGKLIAALEYSAHRISFSPRGDLVALAHPEEKKGAIAVWSPVGGEVARELRTDYTGSVYCITFSKSGKYIASGYRNGKILIWDVESGRVDGRPLEGHTDNVDSVSFSYDEEYLVSGSDDGTIVLWNLQSRTMVYSRLDDLMSWVDTVAFSPTAEYFVSASSTGIACIWRASTGEVIHRLGGCREATYSFDGLQILGFDGRKTIKIWNVLDVDEPPRKLNTIQYCLRVAFAPDGTRFAFSVGGGTIEIWDATVSVVNTERTQLQSGIESAVSSGGRYIASGDSDGTVRVQNTANGMLITGPWKGHGNRVTSVAFSPDEELVASGSLDKTVRVWKALSGESVAIFEGHTDCVRSIAFSPDGKHVASGSNDKTIRVWSVERRRLALTPFKVYSGEASSGEPVATLRGYKHYVNSIAFSPNGKYIASGSEDRIWSIEPGELALTPFKSRRGGVNTIAYSPDGSKIVSGSDDKTVRIWSAITGQLCSTLEGHFDSVRSVAYSPDGFHIATVSDDKTMRLWNAKSGDIESVIDHDTAVRSVCFSSDGTKILSGSKDGTIRAWDSPTCSLFLGPLSVHSGEVISLSFLPNKHFASGYSDGTIRVWSLDDVDWEPQEDGWVVHKDKKLLMWLPKGPRETLITPRNPAIMNAPYNTRVDFSRYLHGNEWTKPIAFTSR